MSGQTRSSKKQALAEIVLIFAVFFVHGAWPVPDVNEPYYLGKAIHFWNPTWVLGDFFLRTADTHEVFYFTFGWLSLWLSPTALAWTGRLLTWVLLAWSWRRLSVAVLPDRWISVLTSVLFIGLLEYGHMAGEWVVGGVEAKGFAFVLVFLAVEAIVRNRWNSVWLLLGAASAFHVLVGGWAAVAAALTWATLGEDRPPLRSMALALVGGLALSLPGLLPSLNLTMGADAHTVARAHEIYVFGRLGHHLAPAYMPAALVFRFVGLVFLWVLLERATPGDGPRRRIRRLVGAAVAIAAVGMAINLFVRFNQPVVAALLRFYWFRLSDVAVPLGIALVIPPFILRWSRQARRWWPTEDRGRRFVVPSALAAVILLTGWLARHGLDGILRGTLPWVLTLECAALVLGALFWLGVWSSPLSASARRLWLPAPLCAAALVAVAGSGVHIAAASVNRLTPTIPRADRLYQYMRQKDRVRDYLAWQEACRWVATSGRIPGDAKFLTPMVAQTFKWYAGRPEVVNWKEIPQDAQSVVIWWDRLEDIYGTGSEDPDQRWHKSLGEVGADRLRRLGERYDADYAITRLWPWVYGLDVVYYNDMYVIYRLGHRAAQ